MHQTETATASYRDQSLGVSFAKHAKAQKRSLCIHQGSSHPRGTPQSKAVLKAFQVFSAAALYQPTRWNTGNNWVTTSSTLHNRCVALVSTAQLIWLTALKLNKIKLYT